MAAAVVLLLASCGDGSKTDTTTKETTTTSTNTSTSTPDATAANTNTGGAWDNESSWKKVDLNAEHKIPMTISVPATANVQKSMNNPGGVRVDFAEFPCAYELGAETSADVKECIEMSKLTNKNDYKDMKILKEDANGYTFTYNTPEGKPSHGFYFAKSAGGKVYSTMLVGSNFEGTEAQLDKLYNGLK